VSSKDPETAEAVKLAAVVALHKQLRATLEVRLTPEDFAWHSNHQDDAIALDYDPATDTVILRHRQPRSDA
jgi:hypothetical protein